MDYKNLNVNTRQRLGRFAETFDLTAWTNRPMSELFNSLLDNVSIAHSEELDAAVQATIQTMANRFTDAMVETPANRLTEAQIDDVVHHCGLELLTGYRVGRAMLGTGADALHYSNPATEGENADKLLQLLEAPAIDDRLSHAGAMPKVWEHYRTRVAGQGPFS